MIQGRKPLAEQPVWHWIRSNVLTFVWSRHQASQHLFRLALNTETMVQNHCSPMMPEILACSHFSPVCQGVGAELEPELLLSKNRRKYCYWVWSCLNVKLPGSQALACVLCCHHSKSWLLLLFFHRGFILPGKFELSVKDCCACILKQIPFHTQRICTISLFLVHDVQVSSCPSLLFQSLYSHPIDWFWIYNAS